MSLEASISLYIDKMTLPDAAAVKKQAFEILTLALTPES